MLQRRINQSIAEYEVLNTLEQSWGGLCTHVRERYNIGKPLYGYKAKVIPHPNPSKADKGHTKSRLKPDGRPGRNSDADRELALPRGRQLRHHRRPAQRRSGTVSAA
ncbi:hypothetical protein GCM10022222_78630 [Amycolatopsis ultiminotia]|uniref:Transposase n=1 Tax=Amycolatopsis ultiminotia TaxID=543629 RepID=A0ABP6YER8_9PSEU